jgi:hypothetical protein
MIERGPATVLLHAGQAALLSDTTAVVSELPLTTYGEGLFFYFSFNDRVLAETIPMNPRTAAFVLMGRDYPICMEGMTPVGNSILQDSRTTERWEIELFDLVYRKGVRSPPESEKRGILAQCLILARNRQCFPFLRLCTDRVVIPRIRILLFLEGLVLARDDTHAALFESFPGGRANLLRSMRNLAMPSPASIIRNRRFELTFAWSEYGGNALSEIAMALQVKNPARFLADYRKWIAATKPFKFRHIDLTRYSDVLLVSEPPYLAPLFSEFWVRRDREEREASGNLTKDELGDRKVLEDIKSISAEWYDELVNGPQPACKLRIGQGPETGEIDPEYLTMKSTGARMAVITHQISQVPGLEDCERWLTAA